MKYKNLIAITLCSAVMALMSYSANAQITIAANGKSAFTIVIPNKAPSSVQNAAKEMQKDIKLATGAKLDIKKDNALKKNPYISLGMTKQAKQAGLSTKDMKYDAYRFVTKNGNLYILGKDTPDGKWTKRNGTSNGTANGTYSFLEDYLDVRWLMPGKIGLDVPKKSTFTLDSIDRSFAPKFSMRNLTMLTYYASSSQTKYIKQWSAHQKTGKRAGATNWNYGHNWWRTINHWGGVRGSSGISRSGISSPAVKKLYKMHPDWFAMDKHGKRPYPKSQYAKLETTNQDLVKWFAKQAIQAFKDSKRPIAYSLSPSDGSSMWSRSPKSKALYDENPDKGYDPEAAIDTTIDTPQNYSMSSLVLKWYDDIAKIVAKKAPGRMVTGYIYSTYVFPPQKVSAKLPDNFSPQIAPSRVYGYGLYRKDVQKYFHNVMNAWADIVTGPWFYYDLPSTLLRQPRAAVGDANFPGGTGLITPPAVDNLNIIFSQLIKSHINGANLYGDPAWSNAALADYIMAKLEWDPTLDARKIQKQWLHRAYGDKAGAKMEQFYQELENIFRNYYQNNEKVRYELTSAMFRDLYGKNYEKLEKLFLVAKKQNMTKPQQKRLQLIEDNLIVLQWRLRNSNILPKDFTSPLQRTDAQISVLIGQVNPYFPNFAGVTNSYRYWGRGWYSNKLPWRVKFSSKTSKNNTSSFPKWDKKAHTRSADLILLYAKQGGDIKITTQMATNGSYFAGYKVTDSAGKLVTSGVLNKEKPIVIPAQAGHTYVLSIPRRKPVTYQLQVKNAATAQGTVKGKTLTLSSKESADVYIFYTSKETKVGVLDNGNNVDIRKPYSKDIAKGYVNSKYVQAQVYPFDSGWLFKPDPKDNGIKRGVLKADFDASSWAPISPLNWWQYQGFPDYLGPAWYRLKFKGKTLEKGESARLYFGGIDGNAQIYLNGKKIKTHTLGKDYKGWNKAFTAIATKQLKPGENILVVKVTSKPVGSSGIFKGVALIVGTRK